MAEAMAIADSEAEIVMNEKTEFGRNMMVITTAKLDGNRCDSNSPKRKKSRPSSLQEDWEARKTGQTSCGRPPKVLKEFEKTGSRQEVISRWITFSKRCKDGNNEQKDSKEN